MTHEEKQKAFVEMIRQNERLILRVCALYTNCCRSELCDLYQDAVCALWESYGSFRGDSKPSTWIYAVTRYTMLNQMRKHRLETEALSRYDASDMADDSDDTHLDDLREAVALLQPEERDIFIMWMEGFKIGEIGDVVGLSYGVVATRITRIKIKLRKILKNEKEAAK